MLRIARFLRSFPGLRLLRSLYSYHMIDLEIQNLQHIFKCAKRLRPAVRYCNWPHRDDDDECPLARPFFFFFVIATMCTWRATIPIFSRSYLILRRLSVRRPSEPSFHLRNPFWGQTARDVYQFDIMLSTSQFSHCASVKLHSSQHGYRL